MMLGPIEGLLSIGVLRLFSRGGQNLSVGAKHTIKRLKHTIFVQIGIYHGDDGICGGGVKAADVTALT